ncbi:hypothetical protein MHYP_G00227080 [Metynnis hypsauchen]
MCNWEVNILLEYGFTATIAVSWFNQISLVVQTCQSSVAPPLPALLPLFLSPPALGGPLALMVAPPLPPSDSASASYCGLEESRGWAVIRISQSSVKGCFHKRPHISSHFSKDTEALEDHTKNMKMGILEVVKESADPSRSLTIVVNVAVVLEEVVVMDNLPDYTNAFILLFGLLYALNIEYPKDLK